MSSPNATLRHAASACSETKLSPKSHVISPASSRATIPSSSKASSSSSNPTVTKIKLRRKGIDLRACGDEINKYEPSSPYYKDLLYKPIDINNEYGSQNHHHHQNNLNSSGGHNNNSNSRVPPTGTASEPPHYKGLTDFSLDIDHGGQHLRSHHDDGWRNIHEVEGAYECSPYFRGLITDSSLAMAIRKLEEGGERGVVPTGFSFFGFNMNLGLCLGGKDERTDFKRQHTLSAPPAPIQLLSLPRPPQPPPLMSMFPSKGMNALSMELKVEDGEKPLEERESEETEEEKAVDITENNKEEAMNESAGLPNDEEVIKKKSSRESVSNNSFEQKVSASSSLSSSESSSDKDVPHQEMKEEEEEEEGSLKKAYVWANKYQPKALQDFICHKHIVSQLLTMIKEGCVCDHFIFEGPPGVGKRTMIRALLREVFGHDQVKVTEGYRTFLLKGEVIGVPIIKSEHHIEVNLSQTKGYEEHVVADLLRGTYDKIINTSIMPCEPKNCQAIIIYEAETLSREWLLYIKWMLESYNKGRNKVFFCCSDESKLQTVQPICKTFRLSPPSSREIVEVLEYIGKEEGKELSLQFLTKVVEKSKNNLRQATRSLEATFHNKDSIKEDDSILTGWEDDISNIAKNMLKEQSSKQLYMIHVKLQSLMIHKVSPDFVYKYLVSELKSLVDESLKPGFEKLEKEYNHKVHGIKMRSGKHFGHAHNKERESEEKNNEITKKINARSYSEVEEFIAKLMSWYKTSICKSDHT